MKNKFYILLAVLALICSACDDKESWLPAFITNYADIRTDAAGNIVSMTLDDGTTYNAQWSPENKNGNAAQSGNDQWSIKPDTLYRAICLYTREKNCATIHSWTLAFAPNPISDTTQLTIKTDPCEIETIWRGGNYINACMLVQGKDQPHIVAFIDKGIKEITTADGSYNQQTILLYHDQNNDPEAFTRTVYLSCPLHNYADMLIQGRDSIAFLVNLQNKGMTAFKLPY
ncbi:MAG: hypothetical protein J5729_01275 [Bacteroidaceae bacterium]|nr:hypothetical protein [Bacteroidaceae bacterium]MBO4592596.1 hypothetical protein [Bacteroidaceae bacterium]